MEECLWVWETLFLFLINFFLNMGWHRCVRMSMIWYFLYVHSSTTASSPVLSCSQLTPPT